MAKDQQYKPVQLCVFDTEHDYPEGEEAHQILAYHPEACSVDDQASVVGLAQALLTFNANFAEVGSQVGVPLVVSSKAKGSALHCRKPHVIACMPSDTCGPSTDRRCTLRC